MFAKIVSQDQRVENPIKTIEALILEINQLLASVEAEKRNGKLGQPEIK